MVSFTEDQFHTIFLWVVGSTYYNLIQFVQFISTYLLKILSCQGGILFSPSISLDKRSLPMLQLEDLFWSPTKLSYVSFSSSKDWMRSDICKRFNESTQYCLLSRCFKNVTINDLGLTWYANKKA